jgi:BarA-like signal transduction histidine kinase
MRTDIEIFQRYPKSFERDQYFLGILLKILVKFRAELTISRASLKGLVSLTAHIFIKFPARMLET